MVTDTAAASDADRVAAAHAARWREIDPLLPDPGPLAAPGEGEMALPAGPDAAGVVRVMHVDEASLDACWTALEVHRLAARVAGPDPEGAMDALLAAWRAALPAGTGPDSAAVVSWPSRDTAVSAAFVRHGLAPLIVIAARPAGRPLPVQPPVTVRPAEPADLDAVVALRLATIRYDAQFGVVSERPGTEERLRELSAKVFARDEPWVWLATRDGEPVGMITVDQPPHADWMGATTAATPIAYVDCLGVFPGSRGAGVGTALLAHAHRALDEAGVPLTLLHHALPNPLSTPTYGRHGYRPLWTVWETRPVTGLR
jgi:GNAT superfamily N-acetyltransferase